MTKRKTDQKTDQKAERLIYCSGPRWEGDGSRESSACEFGQSMTTSAERFKCHYCAVSLNPSEVYADRNGVIRNPKETIMTDQRVQKKGQLRVQETAEPPPPEPSAIEVPLEPSAIEVPPEPSAIEVPPEPSAIEVPPEPSAIEVSSEPSAIEALPEPSAIEAPPDLVTLESTPEPSKKTPKKKSKKKRRRF